MSEKVYAPLTVKAREGRFGEEFRISAQSDRLLAFIKQHTNSRGYINMSMSRRRETGKFGETHSIVLDTWDPQRTTSGRPVDDDFAF